MRWNWGDAFYIFPSLNFLKFLCRRFSAESCNSFRPGNLKDCCLIWQTLLEQIQQSRCSIYPPRFIVLGLVLVNARGYFFQSIFLRFQFFHTQNERVAGSPSSRFCAFVWKMIIKYELWWFNHWQKNSWRMTNFQSQP